MKLMDQIEINININDWRNAPADPVERARILRAIADAAIGAAMIEADKEDVVTGIREELF